MRYSWQNKLCLQKIQKINTGLRVVILDTSPLPPPPRFVLHIYNFQVLLNYISLATRWHELLAVGPKAFHTYLARVMLSIGLKPMEGVTKRKWLLSAWSSMACVSWMKDRLGREATQQSFARAGFFSLGMRFLDRTIWRSLHCYSPWSACCLINTELNSPAWSIWHLSWTLIHLKNKYDKNLT